MINVENNSATGLNHDPAIDLVKRPGFHAIKDDARGSIDW